MTGAKVGFTHLKNFSNPAKDCQKAVSHWSLAIGKRACPSLLLLGTKSYGD